MGAFRILFGIDLVVAAVMLYFFGIGLADGSVSSFNMTLWLGTLAGIAAVLAGGVALNAKGHRKAAIAILSILALPGLLFALFFASLIIMQPRWN